MNSISTKQDKNKIYKLYYVEVVTAKDDVICNPTYKTTEHKNTPRTPLPVKRLYRVRASYI